MLCSQVLGALVETLTDLRADDGEGFRRDRREHRPAPVLRRRRGAKTPLLQTLRPPGADAGWHFLTSPDEPTIRRLADAVGFRYAYDPVTKQYAHPAGLVVLTPEGRVSQYLFGVNFDPKALQTALTTAAAQKIGSPIEQFLMLCFHFNPISGKYGALIIGILRAAGVLTLLCMGGLLVYLIRRDPSRVPVRPA